MMWVDSILLPLGKGSCRSLVHSQKNMRIKFNGMVNSDILISHSSRKKRLTRVPQLHFRVFHRVCWASLMNGVRWKNDNNAVIIIIKLQVLIEIISSSARLYVIILLVFRPRRKLLLIVPTLTMSKCVML